MMMRRLSWSIALTVFVLRRAEVHKETIDVFSERFCNAEPILHDEKPLHSSLRPSETLLTGAQDVMALSIISHKICSRQVYTLISVSARAIGL